MGKKIGVYGGTFDPIHYAHLILAREAMEQLGLERIIFVPAAISPHKLERTPSLTEARLEMLRAAVQGEENFAVDESELRRPPPSFTIETVEEFRRRDADAEIYYLIGSDNLPRLASWRRFEELQRMVQFVVLDRGGMTAASNYPIIRRPIDISATEIRNRVATQRSIRYLVPPEVEAIIVRRRLYQDPTRSTPKN